MIYKLIKPVISVALKQFFRRIDVSGADAVESGALVVVVNHPNFMLDPLLVARTYRRSLWFLAKSTLFKGPLLRWLFSSLHMIPVYRRQDSSGQPVDNVKTFERAVEALRHKKAIALFPEGVSMGERALYPIKTGAARIAFEAESQYNFELGLKMQPIGLTYSDFDRFRSTVTIRLGEPIEIANLKDLYELDSRKAVRKLTSLIQDELSDLSVSLEQPGYEALIEKISTLYQAAGWGEHDHQRFELVAKNVQALAPQQPRRAAMLEQHLDALIEAAEKLKLDPDAGLGARKIDWPLVGLSPLILFGAAANYLPYRLTGRAANWFASHPVMLGSLKLSAGFALFVIWYLLCVILIYLVSSSAVASICALGLIVGTGILANLYYHRLRIMLLALLSSDKKQRIAKLRIEQQRLLAELEGLRIQ